MNVLELINKLDAILEKEPGSESWQVILSTCCDSLPLGEVEQATSWNEAPVVRLNSTGWVLT